MAINESSEHQDDSSEEEEEEEESEESEEGSSDDESYDYGFADGDDDDDEGSEYDVDYASMNVSPEIMRMLGASEEEIAAKEAEVAGVTSTWVAPTETGLEHSAAIADSAAVAIGPGGASKGTEVKRVFKAVGAFDNEGANDPATPGDAPMMKVKILHAPEPVPKRHESKLPPKIDGQDDESEGGGDGSDGDSSWDEASVIDGHAWWETGSDEEMVTSTMSPNLRTALGLGKAPEESAVTTAGEEAGGKDWKPPQFSGLTNSMPLTTLKPLLVGNDDNGLQVEYKKKRVSGDGEQVGDDDDEWSEEEGWDYEDVPDDEYAFDWSTNISPNLARALGQNTDMKKKVEALSAELSWKPPSSSGLNNSAPVIDTSRSPFLSKKRC